MISPLKWIRASRSRPCKVCGGHDNCEESSDGKFGYCGRVSEGSVKQNNGGQSLHVLNDTPGAIDYLNANPKPVESLASKTSASRDWGKFARDAFNHMNAVAARDEMAKLLGVSVKSLERLGIGWLGRHRGWSIPERSATDVIGNNRRLLNGEKRRERGSQAGLTFDPVGWLEWEVNSDVHSPEGMSCTATMLTMGFSAIGRPSNLGGVELLSELLKAVPEDRRIVVVGENDFKPHDSLPPARQKQHKPECQCCSVCWPGKFGAIRTAERLAAIVMREIYWALPPEGFKDCRAWSNAQDRLEGKAAHAT